MTAVLDEIRQLEAARSRGDMDEFAFRIAKAELMDAIEEASQGNVEDDATSMPSRGTVWQIVMFAIIAFIFLTGISAILLGDTTLALTMAVVILAAVTVHAFRTLED